MNGKSGIIKRLTLIILNTRKKGIPQGNNFANTNVNKQTQLSTQTIQNTISNYISRETIVSVMAEIHDEQMRNQSDMKIVPTIPILDIKVILISLAEFQSLQLNYKTTVENPIKSIIHNYLINYQTVK